MAKATDYPPVSWVHAGEWCPLKSVTKGGKVTDCSLRVNFSVVPLGLPMEQGLGVCGKHLTAVIKEVTDEHGVPSVVQEVPVVHRNSRAAVR